MKDRHWSVKELNTASRFGGDTDELKCNGLKTLLNLAAELALRMQEQFVGMGLQNRCPSVTLKKAYSFVVCNRYVYQIRSSGERPEESTSLRCDFYTGPCNRLSEVKRVYKI